MDLKDRSQTDLRPAKGRRDRALIGDARIFRETGMIDMSRLNQEAYAESVLHLESGAVGEGGNNGSNRQADDLAKTSINEIAMNAMFSGAADDDPFNIDANTTSFTSWVDDSWGGYDDVTLRDAETGTYAGGQCKAHWDKVAGETAPATAPGTILETTPPSLTTSSATNPSFADGVTTSTPLAGITSLGVDTESVAPMTPEEHTRASFAVLSGQEKSMSLTDAFTAPAAKGQKLQLIEANGASFETGLTAKPAMNSSLYSLPAPTLGLTGS